MVGWTQQGQALSSHRPPPTSQPAYTKALTSFNKGMIYPTHTHLPPEEMGLKQAHLDGGPDRRIRALLAVQATQAGDSQFSEHRACGE